MYITAILPLPVISITSPSTLVTLVYPSFTVKLVPSTLVTVTLASYNTSVA